MTKLTNLSPPAKFDLCDDCPAASQPSDTGAQRLVGLGFRFWMLGMVTGEIHYWQRAWRLYSGMCGTTGGRLALDGLSCWVKCMANASSRPIEVRLSQTDDFCRDERLAISVIAACQHQVCPAMRACAFALVEHSCIDQTVGQAQSFADTLLGLDLRLSPHAIVAAPIDSAVNSHPH